MEELKNELKKQQEIKKEILNLIGNKGLSFSDKKILQRNLNIISEYIKKLNETIKQFEEIEEKEKQSGIRFLYSR